MDNKIRKLVFSGLMTALIFVATYAVKLPVPFTSGYIHLGDCMIFLAALILGWKYGALAAGLGSMLADLVGGYPHWAIPTLIIKSLMALFIGLAVSMKTTKGKAAYSGVLIILWTAFAFAMKNFLNSGLRGSTDKLVNEVDGVESSVELAGLGRIVQLELTISVVLVVIMIIIISLIARKKYKRFNLMFVQGMVASGLWMVVAYYFAAAIIYGGFIVPIFSIPWNLIQFAIGFIIASALAGPVEKLGLGGMN